MADPKGRRVKTPVFWYQPRGTTAARLAPLGCLYYAVGLVRRALAHPYKAKIPVICIGNVVAGGSGKTPTAIAIGKLLYDNGHKPFFVTRGYGGKKRGPLRMDRFTKEEDVGDEAFLLQRVAPTFVGRDRAAAIRMAEQAGATHVILDDGFQNPHIKPDISLLVIDAVSGLGNGCLIPAGPLREPLDVALRRATAVIMIGDEDNAELESKIRLPIIHARVGCWVKTTDLERGTKFYAFAGIGRPQKFYDTCRKAGLPLVGTQDFADHHVFSMQELEDLKKKAESLGAELITTEKDWMRLPANWRPQTRTLPIYLDFREAESLRRILQITAEN